MKDTTRIQVTIPDSLRLRIGAWRDMFFTGASDGRAILRLIEVGLLSEADRINELHRAGEDRCTARKIGRLLGE